MRWRAPGRMMHRLWARQVADTIRPDGRIDIARLGELVSAIYAAEGQAPVCVEEGDPARSDRDLAASLDARTAELEEARQAMQAALEHVDQGIVLFDADDRVPVCNRRAIKLLDLPEDMMSRRPTCAEVAAYQLAHGEFDDAPTGVKNAALVAQNRLLPNRYERRRPNGILLDIHTTYLPGGGAVRTYTDITDLRASQDDLRRAEADYRGLFENSILGIYRTSLDGHQLRANPTLVRFNGYDCEEEMLAAVRDIASEWYVDPERRAEFGRLMERDGRVTDFVSEVYRHKTRERVWVSEAAWLVRDDKGAPLHYEGTVVDVTQKRQAEERLTWLAHHDTLTDLANRTFFIGELEGTLAAPPENRLISVLAIDLGRFTEVNDTFGHTAGDELLRMAARRVRRAVGPANLAARLGSDEFAVIVRDAATRSDVLQVCERVVNALHLPFRIRRQRTVLGATIGVAFAPEHGATPEVLLRNADTALYAGRASGLLPYALYNDAMNAGLLGRLALEADLRKAMTRDELALHFQPIVDSITGEPVGAEALIRWRHPARGLVPPSEFIPIAEETGLMIALGEWTIMRACQEAAQLFGGLKVAINISPVQFRSANLVPAILAALKASGLPPERLELEITERVLMRDDPFTLQALTELRALGVGVALDDFGSGHASFAYLLKFRFDKIKIDQSFVKSLGLSRENAAIVRAVANLARDLDIAVVAEGVETQAQLAEVRRLGCGLAQGYLFCRPKPAALMLDAVNARKSGTHEAA